jgi:hypothetical protein
MTMFSPVLPLIQTVLSHSHHQIHYTFSDLWEFDICSKISVCLWSMAPENCDVDGQLCFIYFITGKLKECIILNYER